MKKIFFITLFLIICFLFSLGVNTIENKTRTNEYYWGSISPNFYDLNTFKYNAITNNFSIDIFYELDDWHNSNAYIKSPNDENYILYLIFGTEYYPKNNKLEIKYKGYVSAEFIEDKTKQSGYKLSKIKTYYDDNCSYIPKLEEFIEDLRRCLSGGDKLTYDYFIEDVTKNIYNVYKKREGWQKLEYTKNSLEEF
jgi:hypothetical protein